MATPDYPVFEGDGGLNTPKRPVAATDLGGLYKVNDIGWEPDPEKHVTAEDVLQWEMCIERIGRMIPVLSVDFHVSNAMGTENPSAVACVNLGVVTTDITVAKTGTTGEYVVTIPSGVIPPSNLRPMATLSKSDSYSNSGDSANVTVYSYTSTTITIRVRDFTGVLTGVGASVRVDVF